MYNCALAHLHHCIVALLHIFMLACLYCCILAYVHICILAYLQIYKLSIHANMHTCILAYLHDSNFAEKPSWQKVQKNPILLIFLPRFKILSQRFLPHLYSVQCWFWPRLWQWLRTIQSWVFKNLTRIMLKNALYILDPKDN